MAESADKRTIKPNGERIVELRKARGWTQERLKKEAGLDSKRTIAGAEKGENKLLATMDQIAAALGVNVESIVVTDALGTTNPRPAVTEYRMIKDSEQRLGMTIGERVTIRALTDHFRCKVKLNVRVAAGERWFNVDAAVVRGEDLIAIMIFECRGDGIPFLQIDGFLEVAPHAKLDRFQKLVLFVAVVSNAARQVDEDVKARLDKLSITSPIEFQYKMYRLNPLRAKYSI